MAPTTEVLIFDTSEEYRKNSAMLFPAFEAALKAEGAQPPSYYGTQVDGTTGFLFLNWDNYEAHETVMKSPEYAALIKVLRPVIREGGKTDMLHVEFNAPTIALDMPVTEVVVFTLKAPENRAEAVEILSMFSEMSKKVLVFGKAREDENKYVAIAGWETVEAHKQTASKPEVAEAFAKLKSLTNEEYFCYTKLSTYPSTKGE